MNHDRSAKLILNRIKADDFFFVQHANLRSDERGITKANILRCAATCFHWEWQEKHSTYLFLGEFNEAEHGGFTAILRDQVLVITVFKRRLSKWEKNKSKQKS